MDDFSFDEYWARTSPECKTLIEHIAFSVSNTAKKDLNKKHGENYTWGGEDFLSFIAPSGKKHKEVYQTAISELLGQTHRSLEIVSHRGTGEDTAKKSFCYSAYNFEKRFSGSLEQFLLGFIRFTEEHPSNIIFNGFEASIEALKREIKTSVSASSESLKLKPPPTLNNDYYFGNRLIENLIGRKVEQDCLWQFLTCDKPFTWLQLAGVAGQGKSRLAYELILKAEEYDWNAGFLNENELKRMLEKWDDWQPNRPHLIVVDYVIKDIEKISSAFQSLIERSDNFQDNHVRLLLLERQRWDHGIKQNLNQSETNKPSISLGIAELYAAWFLDLNGRSDGLTNNIPGTAFEPNLKALQKLNLDSPIKEEFFSAGIVELTQLTPNELADIVKTIVEKKSELSLSSDDIENIKEQLHDIDKDGRPLYAYFLALQIAAGIGTHGWTRTDLLKNTLARELEKWWRSAFTNDKEFILDNDHPALQLAMLATMTDGIDCQEVKKLYTALNTKDQTRRQALALVGHSALKSSTVAQTIPSLQPDLLGEWLVIQYLTDEPDLKILTEIAWHSSPDKMSEFVQRLTQDFPDESIVKAILNNLDIAPLKKQHLSKIAIALFLHLYYLQSFISSEIIVALELSSKADAEAAFYLGLYYHEGIGAPPDFNKAAQAYRDAIQINPQDTKAYTNLGVSFAELNQHKEAVQAYRQAIQINPKNAKAYTNLGVSFAELNQHKEAVQAYRQAIQINPKNAEAYYNLGISLTKLDRDQEAVQAFRDAIQINPQFAKAYTNLGVSFAELNQHQEAVQAFRDAIQINPQFAEAHYNLGVSLTKLDRDQEAVQAFHDAIQINPQFSEAHNNTGFLLAKLDQHQDAVQSYRDAIQINPQFAEAHFNMGDSLSALNQYQDAEQAYRDTIQINPQHAEAHYNLKQLIKTNNLY